MTSSPVRHKHWLLVMLALLATAFFLDAVYGQPGRPPFPQPPRPIFPPAPRPVIPQPPINQPPIIPPGGFNPGQPAVPPVGPVFENIYYCKRCNTTMARGGPMPARMTCPKCNLEYVNGVAFVPNGQPLAPVANPNTPPANVPPAIIPPLFNPPVTVPADSSSSSSSSARGSNVALGIGIAVVGLLVLAGGAVLVIVIVKTQSAAPRPKRRRRAPDDVPAY